jgi:hypothetical protein
MTIEIQRAILADILDELNNYDRILNRDYCSLNRDATNQLIKIYNTLNEEDDLEKLKEQK